MNTTRDFDRIAQAWLADGPIELSDRVLDAALEEVHHTRQRRVMRVPWRPSTMTSAFKLAAAAAAVLAVLVAGSFIVNRGSGPPVGTTPSPSVVAPSPSPSPLAVATDTFTSARYGFSFDHPAGWISNPARIDWPAGIAYRPGAQWADHLDSADARDIKVAAARQPLQLTETPDDWLAAYIANSAIDASGACGDLSADSYEPVMVGSAQGLFIATVCTEGTDRSLVMEGIVVHDGSGFVVNFGAPEGDEAADRETFERILASFRFPD